MSLEPQSLLHDLNLLEQVEKATLRMVVQAIYDFREEAGEFFIHETDLVADIGEDITREAMDRMGTSTIPVRLFGKIDYKRARYVFHPEYSIRQALFVDSQSGESGRCGNGHDTNGADFMSVRQVRAGAPVDVPGTLPQILSVQDADYLVTTVFVKYNYTEVVETSQKSLESISMTCLPNGMLQERYNPTPTQTFWLAGRNAPSRGESFRARIGLNRLKRLAPWRVQRISLTSATPFVWDE